MRRLTAFSICSLALSLGAGAHSHLSTSEIGLKEEVAELCHHCDSIRHMDSAVAEMINSIRPDSAVNEYYVRNPLNLDQPLIFKGYRSVSNPIASYSPLSINQIVAILYPKVSSTAETIILEEREETEATPIPYQEIVAEETTVSENNPAEPGNQSPVDLNSIPEWLVIALRAQRIQADMEQIFMVNNPQYIYNSYWGLPEPPRLPEEDKSFYGYLKKLDLPEIDPSNALIPEFKTDKRYWLHFFNTGLQFSQAFISTNWYQGGNNYLALLFNFVWNVDLNTNFKPNLLFQSALSYKLGINSNPKEALHRYSISQDNFLYSLKTGIKAFNHWFYSLNLQINTPLFNAYPENSNLRSGAFLSPGTFNLGLGMTYTAQNEKKTFKFSASIAPISYNLKTCIASDIDPTQYNILPGRKTHSEIGSNAEANMTWNISDNISWTSRVFLFSDYHYFLADWENTLNFNINKFLSTQLYLHPRFDSSSDFNSSRWHYWMFKEILSFGLSYTFSTKQ
ncbi:MAG: DUF3078 domain-containing protein [Muribaculaceae bacterium]|nr:DUF3078 domain-containing protein [Muribaculaceae bacterium]